MSESKQHIRELTQEWQKKHGIGDNDPLLAAVELFQIYVESLPTPSLNKITEIPSFTEFRDTLEKLDRISKKFTHVGQDLTKEIRKSIPKKDSGSGVVFVVGIFAGLIGLGVGFVASHFHLIVI